MSTTWNRCATDTLLPIIRFVCGSSNRDTLYNRGCFTNSKGFSVCIVISLNILELCLLRRLPRSGPYSVVNPKPKPPLKSCKRCMIYTETERDSKTQYRLAPNSRIIRTVGGYRKSASTIQRILGGLGGRGHGDHDGQPPGAGSGQRLEEHPRRCCYCILTRELVGRGLSVVSRSSLLKSDSPEADRLFSTSILWSRCSRLSWSPAAPSFL